MSIISDIVARLTRNESRLNDVVNGDDQTVVQTDGGPLPSLAKLIKDKQNKIDQFIPLTDEKEDKDQKDAENGYAGLGDKFMLRVKNAAGTVASFITSVATSAQTFTLPAKGGTFAITDDLHDPETKESILEKLGADKVTGSNTGDQSLESLGAQPKLGYPPLDARLADLPGGFPVLDENAQLPLKYIPDTTKSILEYDSIDDFPASGLEEKFYLDKSTKKAYFWDGTQYQTVGTSNGDTDSIVEGSTNLFFTGQRVLDTVLQGFNLVVNGFVVGTDSVMTAIAKLQLQINNLTTTVGTKAPIANPTFTGTVNVPDASTGTDSNSAVNVRSLNQRITDFNTGNSIALGLKEDSINKASSFNTVNNILYPTIQAVKAYVDALLVSVLKDCGSWDASGNVFPSTGGTGAGGAIIKGNFWYVNTAGTLGGQAVTKGDSFRALVDNPGQTATNWDILEANIGYVPVNQAGDSISFLTVLGQFIANVAATFKGPVTMSGTAADQGGFLKMTRPGYPQWILEDTNQGVDSKRWGGWIEPDGTFSIGPQTDGGTGSYAIQFARNGTLQAHRTTTFIIKSPVVGTGVTLNIDAAAGTSRYLRALSNGVLRWQFGAHTGAETGSNAGSDFVLQRYDDSGNYLDTPVVFNRQTGRASFAIAPSVPTVSNGDNTNASASTQWVQNQKGIANGLAPLGADSKIAAAYLPSYVDDVVEAATYASLPATGETGKIYVVFADENNGGRTWQYRWGGTAYASIIPSPGTTDSVGEGATNLYFTQSRVLNTLLGGLSTAVSGAVVASDTVLQAFGKVQNSLNAILSALGTKVNVQNATMTGTVSMNTTVVNMASDSVPDNLLVGISGQANSYRYLQWRTLGVNRWGMGAIAAAGETGSNAGSDFAMYNYADNGGLIGTVYTISRATGVMSFGQAPIVGTVSNTDISGRAVSTQWISNVKASPNGLASLDSTGKVPAAQLPSYVDDVIEAATYANLPATGETGKIYVVFSDVNNGNKTWQYRWSGSAYVSIIPSPGTTDAVPEGSSNLYFTNARAVNATVSNVAGGGRTKVLDGDAINTAVARLQANFNKLVYDLSGGFSGKVAANDKTLVHVAARTLYLWPSLGTAGQAYAGTAPTSAVTINILIATTQYGTVTFAAGQNVGTVNWASDVTAGVGSVVSFVAPAAADATLADVIITLPCYVASSS